MSTATDKTWFAIHTYSGYENKIKTTIEHRVQLEGLRDRVARVLVPTKKFVEIKNGKKHDVMKNLMPGYVFIEMAPDEEVFALVQKIPGVANFLGDGGKPAPLPAGEIDGLLGNMEDKPEAKARPLITYKVHDQVKVIEGPFANFIGTVQEVDAEKGHLKVMVSIFGRPTAVELDVLQVEGVS